MGNGMGKGIVDRRRMLGGGVMLAALALSGAWTGCATVAPREFTVSERQILAALGTRFPASRRVLELFEVRLSAPKLRLLPTEDRLMLGFDVGVQERLLTARTFKGSLMFSSGLRYEPTDATVRLVRVQHEHLAIEGLPSLLVSSVNRWGGWLASELLDGLVVHQVEQGLLDQASRLGLRPGVLKVTPSGVAVTLEPIRTVPS
jgi:hypothetical protein